MRSQVIVGLLAVCAAWGCGGESETTFTPGSAVVTPGTNAGTIYGVPGIITSQQSPSTSSGLPPGAELYQSAAATVSSTGSGLGTGVLSSTSTTGPSSPGLTGVGGSEPFTNLGGVGASEPFGGIGTFSAQETASVATPEDPDGAGGQGGARAPLGDHGGATAVGVGGAGGEGVGGAGGHGGDCP